MAVLGSMCPVGAVRTVPHQEVYKQIFEAEAQLVHSLNEVRKRSRFPVRSKTPTLFREPKISTDTSLLPHLQQKSAEGRLCCDPAQVPPLSREATTFQKSWKSVAITAAEEVRGLPDFVVPEKRSSNVLDVLSERRQRRHAEALTSMYDEFACVAGEMEPCILEPGKLLLTKLMKSDRKMELLFKEIESDATLEGFALERLEELWNATQQEFSTRKEWVREMDESLRKAEKNRADKINQVLKKYTLRLEEIAFLLQPDVHRLMNHEAMMINRALLANQRAIAKLFFNLMKWELKKKLSHRFRWEDALKAWKIIQKKNLVQGFREFVASDEARSLPTVKKEMENLITDQTLLSEKRLELLQRLGDLLPPRHTKAEMNECYTSLVNLNKSIDTRNEQCVTYIRLQYEMAQQKCLAAVRSHKTNLLDQNLCSKEEAEEIVNSEMLQLTEKLQSQFAEELKRMDGDFEEVAKQNEQNCSDLYSYVQEAMGIWDGHQLRLSRQKDELQKKLLECKKKQDALMQKMEDKLDVLLKQMRTAASAENLKKRLEHALSSLDGIRARYETFNQALRDQVMAYQEAVLRELISYSLSISQYFNVKEVFRQDLEGNIDFTFQDQGLGEASGPEPLQEQQAEQGSTTQEEEQKALKMVSETFSTCSGNSYTVFEVKDTGQTDIPETRFTNYEEKESLPVYLKSVLIEGTMFAELKKGFRLSFFEHLEKWFGDALSHCRDFVAAETEKLNSELQQYLHLHQERRENIQTSICQERTAQLVAHKEDLERHCAEVMKALKNEKEEFLRFRDEQSNMIQNLCGRIRDMESVFLTAPMTEKLVCLNNSVSSELHNQLEGIQASLASYHKYLDDVFGKLKDSNADFLKGCRSFLDGGNYAPEEVKFATKRVKEQEKRIDSAERALRMDLTKTELSCLKQARLLVNQAETNLSFLFMTRDFMQRIKQGLGSLRVQIKAEVLNSNVQVVTINTHLEEIRQKIKDASHSTGDEKALTAEELCDCIEVLLKELKKRSQYLDCLSMRTGSPDADEDFSPLATDAVLEGPTAAAVGTEHLQDKRKLTLMGIDPEKYPALKPSERGTPVINDPIISVVQNILDFQPRRKSSAQSKKKKDSKSLAPAPLPKSKSSHELVSDKDPQNAAPGGSATLITQAASVKKKKKSTRQKRKDAKSGLSINDFLIFGEQPPESDTFKGIITNILWMVNNSLLSLAQDFYGKKKPQIKLPEDLPKTFAHCGEMLKEALLLHKSQTDDYHNSYLTEFQDQLKLCEKELHYLSRLAVERLFEEHEQKLSHSTGQIRHLFSKQLEDWENAKDVHRKQLHPSLGHPNNLPQLDALSQEEIKRQKDQTDGILLNTQKLKDCAAECAQSFVSALAAFTEKLLLQLDDAVTVDDVQVAKTGVPGDKTPTSICHRQVELPLENQEVINLVQRGSRTWPGIPMTTLKDNPDLVLCRETASIRTAKTTWAHVAVVEARDAVYEKYKHNLERQFAQIKEESAAELLAVQRWENWWKRSIQKIKQLYN